jgi:hypothetical protein
MGGPRPVGCLTALVPVVQTGAKDSTGDAGSRRFDRPGGADVGDRGENPAVDRVESGDEIAAGDVVARGEEAGERAVERIAGAVLDAQEVGWVEGPGGSTSRALWRSCLNGSPVRPEISEARPPAAHAVAWRAWGRNHLGFRRNATLIMQDAPRIRTPCPRVPIAFEKKYADWW